ALADEGDTAFATAADDLVGPQRHAVEEVDEAVAVRPEEGQLTCGVQQLRGQLAARGGRGLGEAGREAHEAAGATAGQRGGNGGYLAIGGGDEGCIRRRRQFVHRAEIVLRAGVCATRVHAPQLSLVADHATGCVRRVGPGAADQRHAARGQQAPQRGRVHGAVRPPRSSMRREQGTAAGAAAVLACSSVSAAVTAGGKGALTTPSGCWRTCSSITSAAAAAGPSVPRRSSNAA